MANKVVKNIDCQVDGNIYTKPILWLDCLSLFSLPAVFKTAWRNRGGLVRFINASSIAKFSLKFMAVLVNIPVKVEKLEYSLADMWEGDQSMGIKLQFDWPQLAFNVLKVIQKKQVYHDLCQILPAHKADVYFEKEIYKEIYPLARLLLLARWHKNQESDRLRNYVIIYPDSGLTEAIREIWPDQSILFVSHRSIDLRYIKNQMKLLFSKNDRWIAVSRIPFENKPQNNNSGPAKAKIALHYVEGINTQRRSDIFWYLDSNISPQSVLLYFDLNKSLKNRVEKGVCRQLDDMGILQVVLHPKAVADLKKYKWIKLKKDGGIKELKGEKSRQCNLESWIAIVGRILLADIKHWIAFYSFFNIKVVVDIGAQMTEGVAQNMALDFVDGIRVGIQRSDVSLVEYQPFLRYNANHLFFVWGSQVNIHKNTSPIIDNFVICGYPFGKVFDHKFLKDNSRSQMGNNIKLVIALFDSTFNYDNYFSKDMIENFYRAFINWVINDKEVVIIAKEKKESFYNQLTGIHKLVEHAQKTGRYIRIENALGRLPFDAACAADIAVGIGISSAVMEAVIAGRKGIHCDLPKHYFHPFYKWGYKKIIFDDLSQLMESLKQYKNNPTGEFNLGNWSSCLNLMEPFRDGRAGERIGNYLRWLLETFDRGKNRDEAVQYANKLYTHEWGEDKVVDMRNSKPK